MRASGTVSGQKAGPTPLQEHTRQTTYTYNTCIWERACFNKCAVSACTFQWWSVWTFCLITCINLRFPNLMSHGNKQKFWSTSDRHFTIPWGQGRGAVNANESDAIDNTGRSHDWQWTPWSMYVRIIFILHSFTLYRVYFVNSHKVIIQKKYVLIPMISDMVNVFMSESLNCSLNQHILFLTILSNRQGKTHIL